MGPVKRSEQQYSVQKENEDDGSITFSFPKGYRFRGGIEDAPPAQDSTTDTGETMVSTHTAQDLRLVMALVLLWSCCDWQDQRGRHWSAPDISISMLSCPPSAGSASLLTPPCMCCL